MNQLAVPEEKYCLECGDSKLRKNGITPQGSQKYKCGQCNKTYTEDSYYRLLNKQFVKLICPQCESKRYKKVGKSKSGKQRYQCNDCNKIYMENPAWQIVREIITGINCPSCQSESLKKAGKSKSGKKQYKCKDCGRLFVLNPETKSAKNYLPSDITAEEMFDYDIWDIRILGLERITSSGGYSLNFMGIKTKWIKFALKKWLYYRSSIDTSGTIKSKKDSIAKFDVFLSQQNIIHSQSVNREVIQQYLVWGIDKKLSYSVKMHLITDLKLFLQDCSRFNWAKVTKESLIYPEDYPRDKKSLPRYIHDDVINQLNNSLDALPKPIACMVKLLRDTGIRSSELIRMKLDCLHQDSQGDYWIDVYQIKMKKEINVYVGKDLAADIIRQQEYIKTNFSSDFSYLFCTTKYYSWFDFYGYKEQENLIYRNLNYFEPIPKQIEAKTLRGYLRQLVMEQEIKDSSGELAKLTKLHRFRHTHGTELINNGVPQHIVQKRLGHASPEMTARYAHIHDKTMKKEMEEFWDGRVFNNQGQVIISENPELDTAGMQWIKRNMKAQTLPDGFCGLPVTQSCPVQGSPCLTCSHLRTTVEFLDVHKKRLEETEKLIENARANGWDRQVETNLLIAKNLRKIIRGLEQKEVIHGDEKVSEQEGGKQIA